jgi:hypothetical protein
MGQAREIMDHYGRNEKIKDMLGLILITPMAYVFLVLLFSL